MPRRIPEDKYRCVVDLLKMGKKVRDIVQTCGVNKNTVSSIRRELELRGELPPSGTTGPSTASATTKEERPRDSRTTGGIYIDPRSVESDINFMLTVMRNRLDPKHPIMTKMITDVSWWLHLILDFSKYAIPELMGDDVLVDVSNPEVTAQELVRKLRRIKSSAQEVEEKLRQYDEAMKEAEARIRALEEENRALREALEELKRLYNRVVDETKAMLEDMKRRTSATILFIVKEVPQALPPQVRALYLHTVMPKVREIWS